MTIKNCYILDSSRGFVFNGPLNESLVSVSGYSFYEVPEAIKDRPLKIENGQVIVDFQKEYDDKVEYQKIAFKEYKDEVLKQIQYAEIMGNSTTVADLTDMLNDELIAYENRVLAIVKETE